MTKQENEKVDQSAENSRQAAKSPANVGLLVAAVVVLVAIIGFFVWQRNPNGDPNGTSPTGESIENLSNLRSALAATENLEYEEAGTLWDGLLKAMPGNPSVALNRALNRVLSVHELTRTAVSPQSSKEEKQQARESFTNAFSSAKSAIADYKAAAEDEVMDLWLSSRIQLDQAKLLTLAPMQKSQRKEVLDKLIKGLTADSGQSRRSIILGGPLDDVLQDLEDPADGLPATVLDKASRAMKMLSDNNPDNLFLATRAAGLLIESNDPAASKFVGRTFELAKSIEPLLRRETIKVGLTPKELVDNISKAVDDKDWDEATTLVLQWFNVVNGTELQRTDRRRASPNPLDRLSFEASREMSAEAIKNARIAKGDSPIKFSSSSPIDGDEFTDVIPIDFDLDLRDDLATLSADGLVQLWKNEDGQWTTDGELRLDGSPSHLLFVDLFMVDSSHRDRIKTEGETPKAGGDQKEKVDYATKKRHDTFPGMIAYGKEGLQILGIDGRSKTSADKRLTRLDKQTGLEAVKGVVDVLQGDLEGDGDLDLVVATESDGLRLFINRGNRTFFEVSGEGGFAKTVAIIDLAIADIDRDLDLDVVVLAKDGRVGVLENLLHLQFRGRMLDSIPAVEGATEVAVADVDGNVSWDILIGGTSSTVFAYSQTAEAGIWTLERIEKSDSAASGMQIGDLDNDSWDEIISTSGVQRAGPWGIETTDSIEPIPQTATSVSLSDLNGDGLLDVACLVDGKVTIADNQTESNNKRLGFRFRGIADNASGRVNHYGIGSVLEMRFGPHYRSRIVTSPQTQFGVPAGGSASSIRVIMPNGLTQTVRDPKANTIVEEDQSLLGSCPYLYAWDGEKYAFVTDCLWAAPLGLQVADGIVAKDRPWEYLKVDGDFVRPKDGRYDLRITEELWEVAYLDHLELTAVDHPADVNIWTNEKVGPGNIAEQTIFAFSPQDIHELASATDTDGTDVTDQLGEIDSDFVKAFGQRIRQGLCERHHVEMSFDSPEISENDSVYLVMTGWIMPTDTSLNIQIDQNPALPPPSFPSVWVPDTKAESGWREAIGYMGFPGGKTKTIVVDVTDTINQDDPRLRVQTSAEIYWDCGQLVIQEKRPTIKTHKLSLNAAEMTYHGFSKEMKAGPKSPELYEYSETSPGPKWPPLRGGLTQFGDCLGLLDEWDDAMVVMGSGDEVRLSFSVPKQEVPEGWKRDFVLHCVGWDKDANLNTLTGQATSPLPFREMASYPPNHALGQRPKETWQLNRNHLRRKQSFRAFWYRPQSAPKRFQAATPHPELDPSNPL